jgi:hypothetical protein
LVDYNVFGRNNGRIAGYVAEELLQLRPQREETKGSAPLKRKTSTI